MKLTTKICKGIDYLHIDRLRKLKLPNLTYRRARGDMIETYKLLSGKYDDHASLQLKSNISSLPTCQAMKNKRE